MNTNIFKGRLPQVKQELPAIIYITIAQLCCFYFSSIVSPLGFTMGALVSIVAISVLVSVFIFPERHMALLKVCSFRLSKAPFLKASLTLGPIFLVALFVWYMDFYGISNKKYVLYYAHGAMIFLLMHRAVKRYQEKK